jgi:exopolysaccharide production protein ExoQ
VAEMKLYNWDDIRVAKRKMAEQTRSQALISILEQGVLLSLWLVLVMGLFSPWENFTNPRGDALGVAVGEEKVTHAINILAYVCISLLCLMRWKAVVKTLWLARPILILCGWILLSVFSLRDPAKSGAVRYLMIVGLSAYVASRYDSVQFVGLLTRGFAVAVLASVAVAVLVPRLALSNIGGGYQSALRGAFTHKNWLGSAMSFGVLVSGYSYAVRANRRLFSGLTFLGCLLLLVLSRSATAWISTAAAILVLAVGGAIQSKRAPVLRVFALIGLGLAVVFLITLPLGIFDINLDDLLKDMPRLAGRSSDLTGRTAVWHAVWAAIRDRPFLGHGYGFWDQPSMARTNIWLAAQWEVPHSHNDWLDAGLQLGLVGVVLIAFIWLVSLRRAMWLVFVRYGHGALFFLAILFSCLTRSAAETVMFAPALFVLFWWVTIYIYIARISHLRAAAKAESHEGSGGIGESHGRPNAATATSWSELPRTSGPSHKRLVTPGLGER